MRQAERPVLTELPLRGGNESAQAGAVPRSERSDGASAGPSERVPGRGLTQQMLTSALLSAGRARRMQGLGWAERLDGSFQPHLQCGRRRASAAALTLRRHRRPAQPPLLEPSRGRAPGRSGTHGREGPKARASPSEGIRRQGRALQGPGASRSPNAPGLRGSRQAWSWGWGPVSRVR